MKLKVPSSPDGYFLDMVAFLITLVRYDQVMTLAVSGLFDVTVFDVRAVRRLFSTYSD